MDLAVSAFLAAHSDFVLLETGKIRCTLTGHECKQSVVLLHEHISGRKYAQARQKHELVQNPIDFSQYALIAPHKKNASKVYCRLTKLALNKNVAEIGAFMIFSFLITIA